MIRTLCGFIISMALVAMMGGVALAQGPARLEINATYWGNDSQITHENVAGMAFEDLGILPGHYDVWYSTGPIPAAAMRTRRGIVLVPVPAGTPTSGIIQSDGSVIPFAEVF